MSNQPENDQPSTPRSQRPGAAHGRRAPALLPVVEIVAPPAVAVEEVEMQQLQSVPANPSRGVAEPGFLSRVINCLKCVGLPFCICVPVDNTLPVTKIADRAPARRTHYLSDFITSVQCFLLPTSPLSDVPFFYEAIKAFLGFRVEFKRENCDPSCCPCEVCRVCPHMYSCTCPAQDKHKSTKWCAHIHTMHTLTQGKFGYQLCLYIQTDIRYTLMRHLRALAQGSGFMVELSPLCYETVADNFNMSSTRVELTERDDCSCRLPTTKCKQCEGCRCQFSCSCQDFRIDGQVCQHIQSVAIVRRDGFNFQDFKMPEMDILSLLYATEDKNLQYYTELEHEMSFYIDLELIKEQREPIPNDVFTKSCAEFDGGRVCGTQDFGTEMESAYKISPVFDSVLAKRSGASGSQGSCDSAGEPKKRRIEDKWWVVRRRSASGRTEEECKVRRWIERCICEQEPSPNRTCSRCEICYLHYECTCPQVSAIICRHVHAVHRLEENIQDTEETAAIRVRNILELPAMPPNLLADNENRTLVESTHMPSGAEQRERAVLPAPTD